MQNRYVMTTNYVTKPAVRLARKVNLYDYMCDRHPAEIKPVGCSLKLRNDRSVSIKRGYTGFYDFGSGHGGNPITFLMSFLHYDFKDAVSELCNYAGVDAHTYDDAINHSAEAAVTPRHIATITHTANGSEPSAPRPFTPPVPTKLPYKALYHYLTATRGIPPDIVRYLMQEKLVYQDACHANAVFINRDRTFCEIRGTVPGVSFHRVQCAETSAYWSFTPPGSDANAPPTAYICEAAIDAVSLYAMMLDADILPDHAVYCSIAGVSNQQRVDRIIREMREAGGSGVIAVDNDHAGDLCRERNADCEVWIPASKDWNEDLLALHAA